MSDDLFGDIAAHLAGRRTAGLNAHSCGSVMPNGSAKYYRLQRHLEASTAAEVTLTFANIEAIIGASLPATAHRRTWWTNVMRTPQARAWLGAGYQLRDVSVPEQTVTFVRVTSNSTT